MRHDPYISSDDSKLLRQVLRGYSGRAFLELGAGNGGGLKDAAERFDLVVGTDLVRPRVAVPASAAGFVLADGGRCFRDRTFDLVAFNPPYLESEAVEDPSVDGGPGLAVAKELLGEALRTVKGEGKVLFLLNDAADASRFEEACASKGFRVRTVARQRAFFEELLVYEASREPGA